jgi:ribosomal protein S18 acetylase RimI-like enzyme
MLRALQVGRNMPVGLVLAVSSTEQIVTLEIRMLDSGDNAIFDNVAPDVFDNSTDPVLVAQFLTDPRHHLAVAIDDGQVVGFASGVHYVHPDKPSEMWINEVGVAPSHQGRGIGKAILRTLLRHAERLGCREAWVLTDRSNSPAMRLYASTGGEEAPREQVMFTFFLNRDEGNQRTG